ERILPIILRHFQYPYGYVHMKIESILQPLPFSGGTIKNYNKNNYWIFKTKQKVSLRLTRIRIGIGKIEAEGLYKNKCHWYRNQWHRKIYGTTVTFPAS